MLLTRRMKAQSEDFARDVGAPGVLVISAAQHERQVWREVDVAGQLLTSPMTRCDEPNALGVVDRLDGTIEVARLKNSCLGGPANLVQARRALLVNVCA